MTNCGEIFCLFVHNKLKFCLFAHGKLFLVFEVWEFGEGGGGGL